MYNMLPKSSYHRNSKSNGCCLRPLLWMISADSTRCCGTVLTNSPKESLRGINVFHPINVSMNVPIPSKFHLTFKLLTHFIAQFFNQFFHNNLIQIWHSICTCSSTPFNLHFFLTHSAGSFWQMPSQTHCALWEFFTFASLFPHFLVHVRINRKTKKKGHGMLQSHFLWRLLA